MAQWETRYANSNTCNYKEALRLEATVEEEVRQANAQLASRRRERLARLYEREREAWGEALAKLGLAISTD